MRASIPSPMVAPELRLAIATSYAEGAVTAIARSASRKTVLKRFYTTLYAPRISRLVPGRVRGFRGLDATRRTFPGVSEDTIETLVVGREALRLVAMRMPRMQPAATRAMYDVARRFDRAVARRLNASEINAVVAMYTSAEETAAEARRQDILCMLNVVSAYPGARNRILTELAGLPAGHHELVPPRTQRAIESALETADLLLVPSRFVGKQLTDAGLPEHKIVYQPYGVDLGRFRSLAEGAPDRDPARATVRCLFVGQISYIKGVPVLIEAARRLLHRPVEFRLVGPVVSSDVLVNIPPNVSYQGALPHAEVASAMLNSDVFVLPSLVDVFPLAVLEAMACGLPVVITTNTGSTDLVDRSSGIVVPAGDARALADGLERMIDDVAARRLMGAAARQQLRASSWEAYGNDVVRLLAAHLARDQQETNECRPIA